jgi:polysaccharide biosynthesis protein PslG
MARSLAVAVSIAIVVLAAAAPAGAARRTVPPDFFGMNWDQDIAFDPSPALRDTQFGRIAAAGGETVRALFLWSAAQPQQGGPFDFTRTDGLVSAAAAHHLALLPVVIDAPPWARAFDTDFAPPLSAYDYAAYLKALIGRYGPYGTFWSDNPRVPRIPIRAWQVWNEPHMDYQWSTPGTLEDFAVRYTLLLRVSYQTIKAADPGALVVLAGLANQSPTYLSHLYNFGIKPYFDVAAIHPYTYTPAGVVTLVREARQVMRRFHDGRKPIWVTELGLPASRGRASSNNTLQTSDAGMTRFLTTAYRNLAGVSRKLGVARVYWYTWATSYSHQAGPAIFDFSGLERWTPGAPVAAVPAFGAYVRTARQYEGCAKSVTARCR